MSVAYDLSVIEDWAESAPAGRPLRAVPAVPVRPASCAPDATVTVLHPPVEMAAPVSLRLTARGRAVLAVGVALLGGLFVWLAAASAPTSPAGHPVPASVTVRAGDTLWQIASQIDPQADPAALVSRIEQLNHLSSVDLVPGEVLRLR